MNREIKFRVWEKNQGMMFFSNPIPDDEYNGLFFSCDKGDSTNAGSIELMQFTGLRDKNGKEIYEGDVVRKWNYTKPPNDHSDGKSSVVHWDYSGCGFNLRKPFFHKVLGKMAWEYEIIGNIYSNPELPSNPQ